MNSDFWQTLALAFCLLLVLEGILPFLNPRGWKQMMTQLTDMSDLSLRLWGLGSMLAGVCLLYLIH
ncbi:hypothetical protein WH50_06625 [Pokkaliibacter plantistimulans]|uniref:DUF2065 domain-containing protein n=1 Tax=Pokkaliibacter plantistimulans TaxID=1635171 RepID=A0ABX5LZ99_9GAMM|nr:DUF2065 domain-containing protein [Pokkaliibacter plantistimulans]PXF31999.1 hypothetical protein WH50_06625 [Pokkaliibacter plantistimulans]